MECRNREIPARQILRRFGNDGIARMPPPSVLIMTVSAYRKLRDLNDLDLERSKAELYAAIAQSEARMTQKLAQSEIKLTLKLEDKHFETMKWIFFVYWAATMLSLGVLIVALVRK
jgi:hypothetical protein